MPTDPPETRPSSWLRSPLLHFLVIGAALVGVDFALSGEPTTAPPEARKALTITVPAAVVKRSKHDWEDSGGKPPTATELQGLIDAYVRDEAFYRDALARGLHLGDLIVKRRLIQKMDFITKDLATAAEPSEADLAAFLKANADRYRQPAKLTLSHIFFSRERHGDAAAAKAKEALKTLKSAPRGDKEARALGDPFAREYSFLKADATRLDAVLGAGFAAGLKDLETGAWGGPVASSYGQHLVRIDARHEAAVPPLDAVRHRVRGDVLAERRKESQRALVKRVVDQYTVVIEGEPGG